MSSVKQIEFIYVLLCVLVSTWSGANLFVNAQNCLDSFVNDPNNADATSLYCCDQITAKTFPANVTKLTKLTSISVSYCAITGTMPTLDWGQFTALSSFSFANSGMNSSSSPPDLGGLTQLMTLYLGGELWSDAGAIPDYVGSMINLRSLGCQSCKLKGTLPETLLRGLSKLTALSLASNELTGGIPEWFSEMTNLRSLNLYQNPQLGGTIPASIAGMQTLTQFSMSETGLEGNIETAALRLSALPNLQSLHIKENNFQGSLQSAKFGEMTQLQHLGVNTVNWAKSIPRWLTSLTNLRSLDMAGCVLQGTLPSNLKVLTSLQTLILNQNSLSGSVPASFSRMPMQIFDVELNKLTGALPEELLSWTSLLLLRINGNRFHNPLPEFASSVIISGGELVHLAPGDDCSAPVDATMCSWGANKCSNGECLFPPTQAPTLPAPSPDTRAPTRTTTRAPTHTTGTLSPRPTGSPSMMSNFEPMASSSGGLDSLFYFLGVGVGGGAFMALVVVVCVRLVRQSRARTNMGSDTGDMPIAEVVNTQDHSGIMGTETHSRSSSTRNPRFQDV